MLSFMLAPENLPFAVALLVMLGIALLEGISTLFGAALSGLLDALLPEMPDLHTPGIDLDMELPDGETPYALSRFFSWLRLGQVPVLMLIVIFLTAFGLIGLGLQAVVSSAFSQLAPASLMSIPALLLSLPVVRLFGGVLKRIMPSDETEAVSEASLVGRIATITVGRASQGRPAEARVRDQYGTNHLLMVEPDNQTDVFNAGDEVLLVNKEPIVFKAIANPNSILSDKESKEQ
jgi:membrane protein implicated in regulation of membrane protease activity